MARITGRVLCDGEPAEDAYVQLRDRTNDFIGETRTNASGRFVLYAVAGMWRLAAWLPAGPRTDTVIDIGEDDLEVDLALARVETPTLRGSLSPRGQSRTR